MRHTIFKTLNNRLRREEKEWKKSSVVRFEYSYGFLRRLLFKFSKKPLLSSALIFIASLVGTVFSSFFQFIEIPISISKYSSVELKTSIMGIWSVQATILGLIYPIVIAFVSLLLQKRHNARSFLNIYLHDTAGIFSGLCSVALTLLIGIQLYFLDGTDVLALLNWLYIDISFLILNLLLTAYFLHQTFVYLKPQSRLDSLKRYLINEIWPSEFRRKLGPHLFSNALENNLIKIKQASDDLRNTDVPVIYTRSSFSSRYGVEKLSIEIEKPSTLNDVRFRLLTLATRLIILKNRKIKNRTLVIYPLEPEKEYHGRVTLCKLNEESELGWVIKFLIRRAFRFKKVKANNELSVLDLLKDLKSEVLEALNSKRKEDFKKSLDELVDFVVTLIEASSVSGINYSTIRDSSQHIFARSEFENWLQTLEEIAKPVCDSIDSDESYTRELLYMPRGILYSLSPETSSEIKSYVIRMYYGIFINTSEWWGKTLENQGVSVHDFCNPAELAPPYSGSYKNLARLFIGHFEQSKNTAIIPFQAENLIWQEYQNIFTDLKSHIEINARVLFRAVNNGDKVGVKYTLDTLLKWYPQILSRFDSQGVYRVNKKDFVHAKLMELSWDEINDKYNLFHTRVGDSEAQKSLFLTVCRNYWKDVCYVILYVLNDLYDKCDSDSNDLINFVYESILNGEHPMKDSGSIRGSVNPITGFNDLFNSMVRQNYSGFIGDYNYRGILNSLIDKLKPNRLSELIIGRVSSSWGSNDLQSLNSGFLLMLMLLINNAKKVSDSQKKMIDQWILQDPLRMENLKRSVNDLLTKVQKPEAIDKIVFDSISTNGKQSYEDSIKFTKSYLSELSQEIDDIWQKLISEATIDDSLIEKIEVWANFEVQGILSDKNYFKLFKARELESLGNLNENTINYGVKKSWLTKPLLASTGIDEQLIKDTVKRHLQSNILAEITSKLKTNVINLTEESEFWNIVKEFEEKSSDEGLTPILVVNSEYYPEWLSSVFGYDIVEQHLSPGGIEFERLSNDGIYFGKLNGIKVLVSSFLTRHRELLFTHEEEFLSIDIGSYKERELAKIKLVEEDGDYQLKIILRSKVELAGNESILVNLEKLRQ